MSGVDFAALNDTLGLLIALVSAAFTGYVAIKSIPQVHKLVNENYTKQAEKIAEQTKEITMQAEKIDTIRVQHEKEIADLRAVMDRIADDRLAEAKAAPAQNEAAPIEEIADTLESVQADVIEVKGDVKDVKDQVVMRRTEDKP